ncbi:hypothetical protein [Flavobacterium psychrotolerans]|uniref:BioF2-like acetyltransferase domain-containing protein n=1 Tax=Flavobacterium psychrotolerans TaxID=2169410 RepID=A0A2U1JJ05_9FLAO|nr:hypothetical protein [Flavobacterium psychrotolerans]PWA04868.1 hypothetical protein DB895_08865 [Flavobacterium psychrotolerans]
MEIIEVDSTYYDAVFSRPFHCFNAAAFNSLNGHKCDSIFHLIFRDTKIRLGIIFGLKENILNSPFSAPFGGFEYVNEEIRLQQIDAALEVLEQWAKTKKIQGIKIVSPPFFYKENFLNKVCNCLHRAGYGTTNMELNYQFSTHKLEGDYQATIWNNAKKNFKKALQSDLIFEKIDAEKGQEAYRIIAQNRKEKGFPLHMTWESVATTMSVIPIDFFIVKKEDHAIGAAIVFHVSPKVVQVVYWGDLSQYSEFKTMNFLSYNLFQYYKTQGIEIVDIGPSTKNSIPNFGLCEFKESIGCDISVKTEFFKSFN